LRNLWGSEYIHAALQTVAEENQMMLLMAPIYNYFYQRKNIE
jgi:hypothetical protein